MLNFMKKVDEVNTQRGYALKVGLLKRFSPAELELVRLSLSPYEHFGFTLPCKREVPFGSKMITPEDLLILLKRIQPKVFKDVVYPSLDFKIQPFVADLINKKLRLGITYKRLWKHFGWKPQFEVQLCKLIKPNELENFAAKAHYPLVVEPKINGTRAVLYPSGEVYSRSGKLLKLTPPIGKLPIEYPLDCELTVSSSDNDWNASISASRGLKDYTLKVFDIIIPNLPWKARHEIKVKTVQDLLYNNPDLQMQCIPAFILESPADLHNFMKSFFNEKDLEGLVFKKPNSLYQPGKRNSSWCKWKPRYEDKFLCVDIVEGRGKYELSLGAIVIMTKSGALCKVGTGFSDAQRDFYFRHKDFIVGKHVSVYYKNISKDGMLIEPVFNKVE